MSSRPPEIEPLSNRVFVHRVAAMLLPLAIKGKIRPNFVTLTGLGFGVLAALCYAQWHDPRFAFLGFLMMVCWHIADGLDGALARATGQSSAFGRLLDGVADYSTFVMVNIALILTLPNPGLMFAAALVSGAAHILQSAFYEGVRETYIRRSRGQLIATSRSVAGGWVERLYNRGEAALGNHQTDFDALLQSMPSAERDQTLQYWKKLAASRIMAITPLSANSRTVAIFFACLVGRPWLYWIWETFLLSLLAIAGWRALRQSETLALKQKGNNDI